MKISNEYYEAINSCDSKYDEIFFYGVTSTGIFCRPSCKSRTPNVMNIEIFSSTDAAIEKGYRSCKRCTPLAKLNPECEKVNQVKTYLKKNYSQKISLEQIAIDLNASPYYLYHLFKKWTNETPQKFLLNVRLNKAKQLLKEKIQSISMIANEVGFKNSEHFIVVFKRKYGLTPLKYRKREITNGIKI